MLLNATEQFNKSNWLEHYGLHRLLLANSDEKVFVQLNALYFEIGVTM